MKVIEKTTGNKPKVLLQGIDEFYQLYKNEYPIKYDRLFNREFNNKKIGEFIEVNKFIQLEVGLEKCLAKLIKKPNFKNINWRSEALMDKLTNEKTPMKEIVGLKHKCEYIIFRYFSIQTINRFKSILK